MARQIWRGGMIGAGAWSTMQLQAWAGVERANIVALCDQQLDRLESVASRFDIGQTYANAEEMMARANIDFVDICTRPFSHAILSRLAASHGLPILCQKPFCTDLEEARAVVDFCHEMDVPLMINENHRWQAWFQKAKELLDTGKLGKPFLARIQLRTRISLPEFKHPQAYLAQMPRLIIYEMGVHYLDVLRFLFGDPERIFATMRQASHLMSGEDLAAITLEYKGLIGVIIMSFASVPLIDPSWLLNDQHPAPGLEIDGTEGTLVLEGDGSLNLYRDDKYYSWEFSGRVREESRIAAQQHFIQCLDDGEAFKTSGFNTIKTMALVYASYLSAEEGRVVDMDEFRI